MHTPLLPSSLPPLLLPFSPSSLPHSPPPPSFPQLPIKELRQNKRHKLEVTLYPQGSIQLILEYFINLASMGRKPALLSSGVFGVPIEDVTK